ncbi:Hypothetical protein, putative [Bodo saltans]|uniref:Uncharacterized protein n=1 Tax=Bodo saltans TaxID=75058 RepID=A0A0S4JJL2_BODSA|nr:Hypothetical protein, putative [Bodo saltans]|eukprot:CUG89191.1 Hypothetical protein, putative [Bodo saltans]
MSTPVRPMTDFDMSSAASLNASAVRPDAPDLSAMPSQLGGGGLRPSFVATGSREMEQRFAKQVAESEYKLLEERGRAHEREARLREELARERSAIPKLVEERVQRELADREKSTKAAESNASRIGGTGRPGGAPQQADSGEVNGLKQQLSETQRLLADAERRYQQEKRELLNLRTAQLKNESSKRGQEGDIVGRAMQVMSEYETIVRTSEENSLARLAHHMENFEKEWVRRTRSFEERKSEFEAHLMSKALEALQAHNQDVDAIGQEIAQKTLDMLRQQSSSRLQLEEEVMHHAEQFKVQYKEMLETEFRERCRMYDEKLADRERNLSTILEHERKRIIEAEQKVITEHEAMHVQALNEAMRDISQLREQLVREHQEQQAKAMQDLVERRNSMRDEQSHVIAQVSERVKDVERQCFEAVDSAQNALREMQVHLINKEAEMAKQLLETSAEKEQSRLKEIAALRQDVERHWKGVVEELRSQHLVDIERVTVGFQERLDREHSDQHSKEAELRRAYEQRMIRVEEAADQRWAARVTEGSNALDRHLEVIQALRDDNEQLSAQLSSLQQQFMLREQELGQKVGQIQREHEAVWHRKMEEMRVRYDQLLDEALGGPSGESVSRAEHEKILETVRELEERCVQIKQHEANRLQHERDHLNELWKSRLEEERGDRAIWEQDQLKHMGDLRAEVYADARRKETEVLRRAEQERLRFHEEAMGRTVEERKDRDAFEERVRIEGETRVREAEEELNDAYNEKVRILERRVEEKEIVLERRRLDLKREYTAMEEASKNQAAEWLEKEKREILSDVKSFHEKLVEEQQRIETDRITFEQRLTLQYAEAFEQAKVALQAHITTITRNHIEYWALCEQEWLQHRADEMRLLFEQRVEFEKMIKSQTKRDLHHEREKINSMLAGERAALDARENDIFARADQMRQELEATARDRALNLLDQRNQIHETAEIKRAEEEAKIWEQLEKRILEKERQAEADRRVLEMELRNRYEALMNSERHRMDALMDQHRTEARELYDRQQQGLRQRDEEWHRQRLQMEVDERSTHERNYQEVRNSERHRMDALMDQHRTEARELYDRQQQGLRQRDEEWHRQRLQMEVDERSTHERNYQEVREQAEARVHEERRRFEAAMRLREQEFDAERLRGLDSLEKQLRDHEGATRHQLQALKDDYDRRVRMLTQDMHHQREEYIADLADQERKFQEQRDSYEEAAMSKFEKNLKEMRNVMEKRQREQQVRDIELRESIETQRKDYEAKIHRQYQDHLKSHEERLIKMQEDREQSALRQEKEYQDQLFAVRQDMERTMSNYFSQSDVKSKEVLDATRTQFVAKLEEYYHLVTQERKKRVDSESLLAAAHDELESLRLSMEQYKLEVQRTMHTKYEALFAQVRERTRSDREDQAKKLLEDEEKKVASEILRRENEKKIDTFGFSALNGSSIGAVAASPRVGGAPSSSSYAAPLGHAARTTATIIHQQQDTIQTSIGLGTPPPSSSRPTPSQRQTPLPHQQAVAVDGSTVDPFVETIQKRQEKLKQLWNVLDVPESERSGFSDRLIGATQPAALEALTLEIRRLEQQLPLLEVITRREFVQHRVRELEKKPASQKQAEEFGRELLKLTDHLRNEIPKYESKNGQKFMFRGKRFMDTLLTEVEQDIRAAGGMRPTVS